ncbi:MAG: LON peptidase substrate-binding domain-containing protein [Armatimonadetes bacterium]|nr:LON peptidase substrate-binding domain-containing protein [Armatimonadota bacterium]
MPATEVPLFPLELVLFPGMLFPLQIFEPRYLEMLQECLRGDKRFGVLLVTPELGDHPARVGTMALIRECQEIQDGRYMLLVTGEERVRVIEFVPRGERLFGRVETVEDEPFDAAAHAEILREATHYTLEQVRLIRAALGRSQLTEEVPDDPVALSFLLAGMADLTLVEKQQMLESTDTGERLNVVCAALRVQIGKLRRRMEVHETVERVRGGNGRLGNEHLSRSVLEQFGE